MRFVRLDDDRVAFVEFAVDDQRRKRFLDVVHQRTFERADSDDGEPGGTAGVPIYEVLRKEGLTDVCCVVTRYFGGVLLGAGGLVRAYTKGAKDAVDAAQIKCMAEAVKLAVTVDYGLYGRLAQVFADFDARVEDERFADNVRIVLHIRAENSQKLTDKLVDVCNGAVSVEEIEKLNFDFA